MFVGGLTALNVILIRFIPQTGRRTGRLVLASYAAGAAAAVLIALGFLLTLRAVAESFAHLRGVDPGLWFLGMALAWNIFTQQDAVFTGLRRAHWVPIENAAFGIAKMALLVAFAGLLPGQGVVLSWMLPVLVSLVPVNVFIFRRLIPAHVRETDGRGPRPTGAEIGRYMGGVRRRAVRARHDQPHPRRRRDPDRRAQQRLLQHGLGARHDADAAVDHHGDVTDRGSAFDGARFAAKVRAALGARSCCSSRRPR